MWWVRDLSSLNAIKLINTKVHKFIISRYEGNHQMRKTANEVK